MINKIEQMNTEEIKKRLSRLEDAIFFTEMKDHWDKEDYDKVDEMNLEIKMLIGELGRRKIKASYDVMTGVVYE